MQFQVTACSSCIVFLLIGSVVSAQQQLSLENPETMLTPPPVCSHDNNVCNILIKNESSAVDEIEQVCTCENGKLCPSTISKTNTIRFLDSEWFLTCANLDTIPACQGDEVSLFSQMENLDEPVNFLVKCTCPGGYDTNGALWRLDGTKVLVEIFCNDNQNLYEGPRDDYDYNNNNENQQPVEMKRGRDNSAFYKRRSSGDLYSFYKRGGSNLSGFYKRGLNSLQTFYKKAAFYKRAAESQPKGTPSKRSVHYYKTFYKRAPFGNLNAFYKRGFTQDSSLDLDKKNYGLFSFYKRGYGSNDNAFYKRAGFGISSFYKRAVYQPADLRLSDTDDEILSVPDEKLQTKDRSSFDNQKFEGGHVRLFYKPYTILGRIPSHHSLGTSIDYGRRDPDSYRR